jgi:hypothetical protein
MSFTNGLLDRFPKIVPSYERILNKKESDASLFSIIPKGLKSYLWFTYIEDKNICCLLPLDNKKRIVSIDYQQSCFNSALSMGQYGTILYGTSFYTYENGIKIRCFSCEDIIYYKGTRMEWTKQTSYLSSKEIVDLFTCQIKQVLYNKSLIICGLPITTRQISEAYECINSLPYKVYGIQQRSSSGRVIGLTIIRSINGSSKIVDSTPVSVSVSLIQTSSCNFNKSNNTINHTIKDTNNVCETIFKVTPSIQPDIYELHCQDDDNNKREICYGIAMIPTYKSSIFMNGLFRNIKENSNLDLLEESDDEEEFQDNRENKFVSLDKHLYMKCVFNKKFNKWQPIKVIDEGINVFRLITKKEVLSIEQNSRIGINNKK